MGIPGKTVTRIQPLIEFDDGKTRSAARELGFPIVPDICAELWGSGLEQGRRFFSKCVERLTQTVPPPGRAPSVLHADYRKLIRTYEHMGVLPPVEELDGAVYRFCDPAMREPPPFQLAR